MDHVIILDGTMSSLHPGDETNAGLTYRLLSEGGVRAGLSVYYEPGFQWDTWHQVQPVVIGRGISRQIRRAYGYLSSRWRPGDRVFLLGYSRGAFAVRSLAGIVDRIGLLRPDCATERNVRAIYRHYRGAPASDAARAFARAHCHDRAEIEMVGVWDTVKALGLRMPLLWMLSEPHTTFHDARLGRTIRHGFHALAMHETRAVFTPVMWDTSGDRPPGQVVEQVWFRGAHGDVGGQLGGFHPARPLANIPLVWMLERMEACGLGLPPGWRVRFPRDATAPMVGTFRSWGKSFLIRSRRPMGRDPTEAVHPTALRPDARLLPGRVG